MNNSLELWVINILILSAFRTSLCVTYLSILYINYLRVPYIISRQPIYKK